MIKSFTPCSDDNLRILSLSSSIVRLGLSSIYKGELNKRKICSSSFSHSSWLSLPFRIFSPSISHTLEISRFTSFTLLISMEKNAQGIFPSTATFLAIDIAKEVFPVLPCPAITITSEGFSPLVTTSIAEKPVFITIVSIITLFSNYFQISIFLLYLIISSLSSGRTPIATSEEV